MKKFFKKLGFRKMDEMEKNIALKSQRNALVYVLAALLIWSFYESYKVFEYHNSINLTPCFLLVSTSWILILSQWFLKNQAVKGDDEIVEQNPIRNQILIGGMAFLIIIAVGITFLIVGR